jgi:hypothetical protein
MIHKIVFTVPFYHACRAQPLTSSVVKLWGYKAGVVAPAQPTSSHTISHHSSASFPTIEM